MLRCSNRSIFSAMEQLPDRVLYDIGNVTDPTRFMQLLGETLNDIATRASAGGLGKKVAVVEANFTSSQKLYALAQCMPDLTASDCVKCLQFGIANLPQGKQGGRVLTPSCNVRYQLYPFYNASAILAPAPPPPAPGTGPKGKSNEAAGIIFVFTFRVSESVVILFLAACFSRRNANKKNAVIQGDQSGLIEMTNAESLRYDLATIQAAADNFSDQNKLGKGGFGEAFQGTLPNGKLIAVKRPCQGSQQGAEEFENEVMLLAKHQH